MNPTTRTAPATTKPSPFVIGEDFDASLPPAHADDFDDEDDITPAWARAVNVADAVARLRFALPGQPSCAG